MIHWLSMIACMVCFAVAFLNLFLGGTGGQAVADQCTRNVAIYAGLALIFGLTFVFT